MHEGVSGQSRRLIVRWSRRIVATPRHNDVISTASKVPYCHGN